jgi:FLVCR family MFS transporter 7
LHYVHVYINIFVYVVSYPVPESISSSLLMAISTAATLIFTVVIDALRAGPEADPPNNMKLSMIVAVVIVGVGSLPAIWLKGDLKRLAFDQEAQLQQQTQREEIDEKETIF